MSPRITEGAAVFSRSYTMKKISNLINFIIKRVNYLACLDETGAAFIEFAITLPTLALLLVGTTNYGVAWYNWKKMHELVEAIVIYLQSPNGSNSLSNAQIIGDGSSFNGSSVTNAVLAANPDLNNAGTPSYTVSCGCPSGGTISLTAASTLPPPFCLMPSSSTQTCGTGLYWGTYVTVTVQNNFTPLFPAYFSSQNLAVKAIVKIY